MKQLTSPGTIQSTSSNYLSGIDALFGAWFRLQVGRGFQGGCLSRAFRAAVAHAWPLAPILSFGAEGPNGPIEFTHFADLLVHELLHGIAALC